MKILILGIGNILLGDEGIGVQAAMCLRQNLEFIGPHEVDILDGGTLAHQLIPTMALYNHLVIIDAIRADDVAPGEVYFFDMDRVPTGVTWKSTVHEVEMLQSLSMMELVGDRPQTFVLGVVPLEITGLSFTLSPAVTAAYGVIERTLTEHLVGLGMVVRKVQHHPVEKIADVLRQRWEENEGVK
ncbi:HyaD/HybD family hydrogenase maturation endopeptidase [Desulfurispirillum indicum]|uniref:HyaD/HybD family hydrogenase maturation endopeptidase n=1 Tax=Desulfurispirillum indicum TaxID=936456 RepID=UPI001CFA3877|nr:HyaD/HybD family hydrogenase maturation endopeptidase [Desulfurispirillum indicum]UCZ57757.1 HyaD/HybD family hydrogenase maturation endopeptidase [Desulfurispirillum indicum]